MQCIATTQKGDPCKNKAFINGKCFFHGIGVSRQRIYTDEELVSHKREYDNLYNKTKRKWKKKII